MKGRAVFTAVVLSATFNCLLCLAQSAAGGGTILGTVKDASDAAIPVQHDSESRRLLRHADSRHRKIQDPRGIGTVPAQFQPGAVPQHRVRWNFSYDMPFGRGRHFARNAGKLVNSVIGGWKLAGSGTVVSSWFTLPTNNWGPMGKLEVYRTKYKILDCRATSPTATDPRDERCYEGYLWYNGYISNRLINSRNAAGLRNGVYGLPANYKPVQTPVNPWPVGGLPTDPRANLYDTNNVNIRLANGSNPQVAYDTGLYPFRNQYLLGPFNWTQDASMLKFFSITERARLGWRRDSAELVWRLRYAPAAGAGGHADGVVEVWGGASLVFWKKRLDLGLDVVSVHQCRHVSGCHPPLSIDEECVRQILDAESLRCRLVPQ